MVPSRTRSVCPARNPSVVYASSISVSSGPAVGSACSRWSATHTVSTPAWSAARTSRISSAPSPPGPLGHEKFVTLMLTRILRAFLSCCRSSRVRSGQPHDPRVPGVVAGQLGAHRGGGGQRDARLLHPPQRDAVAGRGRRTAGIGYEDDLVAVAVGVQGGGHPAHLRADPSRDQLAPAGSGDCL